MRLIIDTRQTTEDPERFGTILRWDGPWAVIETFNDKMTKRCLALGKRIVARTGPEEKTKKEKTDDGCSSADRADHSTPPHTD